MGRVLKMYRKTSPFPTRPIKEYLLQEKHPRSIDTRNTYNGFMENYVIMQKMVIQPKNLYHNGLIPLPKAKYDQLQELKQFVAVNLQRYYEELPYIRTGQEDGDDEQVNKDDEQ
ncbi:dna-directed rna polymerases i ii and iii subunit rpabc2 [Holotrichia oblita]|uniref:Dna-directed rna polymerases i ii and iii subunit rpabc2 n=1 Tax=Holotrichia oblita TaxID=644536 RepID=A0ACB9TZ73_HOLOL|nr:dna-directed rna polymerases i ii and iii subunit rpabc2 [Holotrichia oblita]